MNSRVRVANNVDAASRYGAAPRIVVGISDTDSGHAALDRALEEAALRGASLHLVRVWRDLGGRFSAGPEERRDRERADGLALVRAAETAHTRAHGLHVIPEFVPGDLQAVLRDRARGADLLVVGAGEGAVTPHLISEWFQQRLACPVLVVGEGEPAEPVEPAEPAATPAAAAHPQMSHAGLPATASAR
jgi:nucleotide-binding universal stress UspA family protein